MSMPGGNFDEFEACRRQFEHAALGDVDDGLRAARGILACERDLLDVFHELARAAFLDDANLAVFDRDFETTAVNVPAKATARAF